MHDFDLDENGNLKPAQGNNDGRHRRRERQVARQPGKITKVFIYIAGVLLAAFLGTFCAYAYTNGGFGAAYAALRAMATADPAAAFGKPTVRILIMGLDENWTGDDEAYTSTSRSDTMIASNVDLTSKQVGLLSIPRDLWVDIPKDGFAKINEAVADGGPQRAELAAAQALGAPAFDYYFVLRIDATKNIADALGGLDVDVEKDMDYDDAWGHLHIHLRKGLQHLSGDQVVGYIRFRHDPEGDIGRMRRQRQVMRILAQRLHEPSIIWRIPALLAIIRANVRTNMPADKMLVLAMAMRGVTPQRVHAGEVPATPDFIDGESVLILDRATAGAVVRKYLITGFR